MKSIFLVMLLSLSATADDKASKQYRERVECLPQKLSPTEKTDKPGFSLDIDRAVSDVSASSVKRQYEFPSGEARVLFNLSYVPPTDGKKAHFSLAKAYLKKEMRKGKDNKDIIEWKLMLTMGSPQTIPCPLDPNTTYGMATAKFDVIPAFEVHCWLEREKISKDCVNCR